MGSVEYGARQVIDNCMKIRNNENLAIITDRETLAIGNAILDAAKKRTGNIEYFVLEDFGNRPEDGVNPLECPEKILESLKRVDASIYCAKGKKNELHSLRMPMLKVIDKRGKNGEMRHGHMPGISKEIMETGMSADYAEVQRIGRKVYDIVKDAGEIRVTTERGTVLTAKFERKGSPKLKWINCDGDIGARGKPWSNLPDGEVFTSPRYISGHVVADGCLGDYFETYGDIEITPVIMDIKRGRIVKGSVKCLDNKLETELNKYIFETDENSNRIGEFAIGTNIGLKKIIGNLLQDEKFPGVHIAWGSPYPSQTGATWDSKAHCDGVIRNTDIIVDGHKIMKEGKYLI